MPSLDDPMLEAVFELVRDTQTMIRTANERLAEGDHVAAERLYREVLRLDPDSYDAHLNLGVLHGLADRNQEAAAALERAIEIDPERADAYALLTIAYIRTGRAEDGLRQLERALELDPDHPRAREVLHNLGGDPEEIPLTFVVWPHWDGFCAAWSPARGSCPGEIPGRFRSWSG